MTEYLSWIISLVVGEGLAIISGILFWFGKQVKYNTIVDELKTNKDELQKKIDTLRTDVDKLQEFKTYAQKFIDSVIYKAKSQLQLTEVGKALVQESGFEEIFENVKNDLVKMLEKINPKTKYDIQEKARALMDDLVDYPPFVPIKEYAFKFGKDVGQILRAGAILLRDYYLYIHQEIEK